MTKSESCLSLPHSFPPSAISDFPKGPGGNFQFSNRLVYRQVRDLHPPVPAGLSAGLDVAAAKPEVAARPENQEWGQSETRLIELYLQARLPAADSGKWACAPSGKEQRPDPIERQKSSLAI